jgi:hypothetical protein
VIGIAWPRVDSRHVLHGSYERAIGLRRDDPALSAMGWENVFLSALPIVELQARSTMWSSTTSFSNSRRVQRARPLGGLEQSQGNQFGLFLAVKNPGNRRRCSLLAAQHRLEAFLRQLLPHPVNHGNAGVQSLDNPTIAPAFTGFRHTSAFNNIRAFSIRCAGLFPVRTSASNCSRSSPLSRTAYLFTEISFVAMIVSVARVATKANHQIIALSN